MRTRPYFVTQTDLLPTAGLERACELLTGRIAKANDGGNDKLFFKLAGTLHRFVRCLLGIAWSNYYFTIRKRALASPRSREELLAKLGGAHALLRWRRKEVWNKGRLAAIADGTYRRPGAQPWDACVPRKPEKTRKAKPAQKRTTLSKAPPEFRLPPLKDLLRDPHNPIIFTGERAAPNPHIPVVVIWPHEIDGQYVPNFTSRARRPQSGEAVPDPGPARTDFSPQAPDGAPP